MSTQSIQKTPVLETPAILPGPTRSMRQSNLQEYKDDDELLCPYEGCTDTFDTQRGRSVHHQMKHGESLTKKERSCEVCGSTFTYYSSTLDQTTCSNKCDGVRRSESVELTCSKCGDTYEVDPQFEDESQYCTQECYWDSMGHGDVTLTCSHCGDEFERKKSRTNQNKTGNYFCGLDCYRESRNIGVRYGCVDTIYRGIRDYFADGCWRDFANKRREDECEKCGCSKNLEVHHVIPILSGGTHGDYNLHTLCKECHSRAEMLSKARMGFDMMELVD